MKNLQSAQIITQVINYWSGQNKLIEKLFTRYADTAYLRPIAPGRNSGAFVMAHLIAASDAMLPMLDMGDLLFPELAPLISLPESANYIKLDPVELRAKWTIVNSFLEKKFNAMTVSEWFEKHTMVSQEDFEKEPLRNKLSILISRAGHVSYHRGQLILIHEHPSAV
jgi:hypothetical protein